MVVLGVGLTAAEWARLHHTDPTASLGRLRPVLAREAAYDALVARVVVRPTRGSPRTTRLSESDVVDAYADAADTGSQWASRLVRWTHNGNAQRYLTGVVLGAVAVALVIGVVGIGGPG